MAYPTPDLPSYLTDPKSAQVMYRPIAQLSKLPPPPTPNDPVDHPSVVFWRRELLRSKKGWFAPDGTWFNGMAYWYFNHSSMDYVDEVSGRTVQGPPMYTRLHHEILDEVWACQGKNRPVVRHKRGKKKKKGSDIYESEEVLEVQAGTYQNAEDLIVTKGRRKGWSFTMLGGAIPWKFCVERSDNIGVGFDSRDSREEGQSLFMAIYDRLHPYWKHPELYTRAAKQVSAVRYERVKGGKLEKTEGIKLYFAEVDKSIGKLRGKRLCMLFLDEAGKYTNLEKVLGTVEHCLRVGNMKFGSLILGGTCDPITNKSKDYKERWDAALKMGWHRLFIPAWRYHTVDYQTGADLEGPSRAYYEAQRAMKKEAGMMEAYYMEVQENPLEETELFQLPTLSEYPALLLADQAGRIAEEGEDNKTHRGRLEWVTNSVGRSVGRVDWIPDPNGYWRMQNGYEPRPDLGIDVLGVDDVMKDKVTDSDSKMGMALFRRFHHRLPDSSDQFVMAYDHRPTLDDFADEVWKAMVYTGCYTILEVNHKHVADYLVEHDAGLLDKLLEYSGEIGLKQTVLTLNRQTLLMSAWIRRGGLKRTWISSIIDGLKVWRQKNHDVISAAHTAIMGADTMDEFDAKRRDDDDAAPPPPRGRLGRPDHERTLPPREEGARANPRARLGRRQTG